MEENNTKICSKCKQEKDFTAFSKGSGKFGLKNYCKECSRLKDKVLYLENRPARIEKAAEWNKTHTENVKINQKNWRERNK